MRSLLACACLLGSASAQGGHGVLALPYTASWVAPSFYAGPWVPAGSSPTNFVCRVALPGGGFVAGRANAAVSSCVAPINGSEYTTPIATGALVLDSRLAWSNSGSPLPPESVLVSAGAPYLSQPSYVCRGVPPAAPGAVSGSTTGAVLSAVGAPVCLVAAGGGRLAALVAPAFDWLVGFPSDASLQPPAAGLQPAVPSSSPTPTITASATPSPTVLAGGSVSWYSASLGYAGAVIAGTEGASSIFVCAGRLSTGDIVPGKYESIWSFCDISVEGVEVNEASYTLLRASPWLIWAAAVPSGTSYRPYRPPVVGAVPVVGGSYQSRALTVCRAWHPTARTGPHSGFVDGVTVSPATNTPACLFSWGGGTVKAATFDILFLAPTSFSAAAAIAAAANATTVPQPPPSPSVTPSRTASNSPTVSVTPSVTPSPLPPSAVVWASGVSYGSASGAVTRYMRTGSSSSGGAVFACRYTLPSGDVLVGSYGSQVCDVNTDGLSVATWGLSASLLLRTPWLVWSLPTAVDSAASVVVAGTLGGAPVSVCRAWHPTTLTGPHTGYTSGSRCLISTNYVNAAVAAPAFEVLSLLSSNMTASDAAAWAAMQPALPAPSFSSTPSLTGTPSATLAPPVPGVAQWLPFSGTFPGGVASGTDTLPTETIFVCRGYDVSGNIVPGKMLAEWTWCDVALTGLELIDATFDVLRGNPWLQWVPAVIAPAPGAALVAVPLPAGAVPVVGGVVNGMSVTVCRARHPTSGSGPHAGYSDGGLYLGLPLCFFSWGGITVRSAPFDVLVLMAPSASPSVRASPSITPSGTPSAPATPSKTPSPTPPPTPPRTPSGSKTRSLPVSASATPSATPSAPAAAAASPSPSPTVADAAAPPSASFLPLLASRTPSSTPSSMAGAAAGGSNAGSTAGIVILAIACVIAAVYFVRGGRKAPRAAGALKLPEEEAPGEVAAAGGGGGGGANATALPAKGAAGSAAAAAATSAASKPPAAGRTDTAAVVVTFPSSAGGTRTSAPVAAKAGAAVAPPPVAAKAGAAVAPPPVAAKTGGSAGAAPLPGATSPDWS